MSQAARALRSGSVVVLLLILTRPAAAQPAEEAVRFQYTAPDDCPDLSGFTARVRERTTSGRLAEEGELARTFNLVVAAEPSGFSGQIEFLDEGGSNVNRQLRGEQCEAVVSGLALITALALDASLREVDAPSEPAPAEKAAPSPAQLRPPVSKKTAEPAPPSPRPVRPALRARLGVGGAFGSALHSEQSGWFAPQLALIGQVERPRSYALRLSAHTEARQVPVDEGRSASLRLLAVETSFCPRFWRYQSISLFPCAVVDLGSLRAEGNKSDKLTVPGGKSIWWAAVGAEVRLTVDAANLPVWAELRAGAAAPLRATYQFWLRSPDALAYEVPRMTAVGGMALGVRFR